MSIKAKKQETEFVLTPAGNHVGRIYNIIHIGSVKEEFEGKEMTRDKVRITFELPNELHEFKEGEGEKPFSISQEYTLSMDERAKLRQHIEGMFGVVLPPEEVEEFDVGDLLGKACMVNVAHKTSKSSGRKYALISGLAPLPKGMEAPEPFNDTMLLDYYENWSDEKFEVLPDFIKDKMKETPEYQVKFGDKLEEVADGGEEKTDDEIVAESTPF